MAPRISVVVPTCNRQERLVACLHSLEGQSLPADSYEVIVVVDGSTDGTAAFLAGYRPPYRLRHLVQDNRGLCAARNAGNALAEADIILCLDDDMIASTDLLAEHLRAHQPPRELLVQGGLELHSSLARTPFLRYEEKLRARFAREKSRPGATMDGEDISGGNISLPRALLAAVGGFNEALKGLRNTDGELAYRLTRRGVPIVYRHRALAFMAHSNDYRQSLRASFLYGRSYVFSQRQYPESIWQLSPLRNGASPGLAALRRIYLRPRRQWGLDGFERLLPALTRAAESVGAEPVAEALYRLAGDYFFWKGVHAESGGRLEDFLPRGISILCYHQVSDRKNPRFRHYILPVRTFARQVRWLQRAGYTAISLDQLHGYLTRGTPLPPRPVVITFDDGYRELKTTATPLLRELGLRHTHFLTTGKLGGTTDWVERAPDLALLTADDVRDMAALPGDTVDFQAHGHNHLSMEGLDPDRARLEVRRSIERIEELTGRPVRYLAYPFGDFDATTPATMREVGLNASFTVARGLARPGQDLHLLPRVEVFSNDFWFDFRLKARFGWSPLASLRIVVGSILQQLRDVFLPQPPPPQR